MSGEPPSLCNNIAEAVLKESERRNILARQTILQALVLMGILCPLFVFLRIYLIASILCFCGLLFGLFLFWFRRGEHLRAKVGLVLTQNIGLVALSYTGGYESLIHYPLLSQLMLAFLLFSSEERAFALFAALTPTAAFLGIELAYMNHGWVGVLPPETRQTVRGLAILGTLGELIGRSWNLYTSNQRNEELLRMSLEDALRATEEQQKASQIKSQFLANTSHEIRTPMNGILGTARLLADTPLSEDQRGLLETLHESAGNMMSLVNDLLDLSKIEAGKIELERVVFSLTELTEECHRLMEPLAKQKSLELRLDAAPDLAPWRTGDPTRLRQVLLNLLNNAIKFTLRGEVRLSVQQGDASDGVRFEVSDTGIGIPADQLDRIFEAFAQADGTFTRRFGGTGLGLTISRDLVALMGGQLQAQSRPKQGSAFFFQCSLPPGTPTSPRLPLDLPPSQPLRLLLVEDNSINERIARRMLEKLGHQVTSVTTGLDALELSEGPFDVVLMDIQMPGLDGLETTRRIRAREAEKSAPRLPIIALTANAMKGDEELCRATGMDGYLSKPLDPGLLRRTLDEVARGAGLDQHFPARVHVSRS